MEKTQKNRRKKTEKNISKTYTHPPHRWLRIQRMLNKHKDISQNDGQMYLSETIAM